MKFLFQDKDLNVKGGYEVAQDWEFLVSATSCYNCYGFMTTLIFSEYCLLN